MNYANKRLLMGGKWLRWNPMTNRTDLLYMKSRYSAKMTEMFSLFEEHSSTTKKPPIGDQLAAVVDDDNKPVVQAATKPATAEPETVAPNTKQTPAERVAPARKQARTTLKRGLPAPSPTGSEVSPSEKRQGRASSRGKHDDADKPEPSTVDVKQMNNKIKEAQTLHSQILMTQAQHRDHLDCLEAGHEDYRKMNHEQVKIDLDAAYNPLMQALKTQELYTEFMRHDMAELKAKLSPPLLMKRLDSFCGISSLLDKLNQEHQQLRDFANISKRIRLQQQ